MRRRPARTEFAAWVKHWTHGAIRLSVPLGHLERQPTLSEEAYDGLIELNRARYCGALADGIGFDAVPEPLQLAEDIGEASAPSPESAPELRPAPFEDDAPPPRPRTPPSSAEPRELGKGGAKHRYLQQLVSGLAQQQGMRATIEAPIQGGQVDVLLERDDLAVAVEVSVTTPVAWERENLRKCFDAGFSRVALVLAKSKTTAKRYREEVVGALSDDERARLAILDPEDVPDFIASLAPATPPEDNIVRGYRVKVSRTEVSAEEAAARREALARLMADSMRRQLE
jgi:hypothetical protein